MRLVSLCIVMDEPDKSIRSSRCQNEFMFSTRVALISKLELLVAMQYCRVMIEPIWGLNTSRMEVNKRRRPPLLLVNTAISSSYNINNIRNNLPQSILRNNLLYISYFRANFWIISSIGMPVGFITGLWLVIICINVGLVHINIITHWLSIGTDFFVC